MENAFRSRPNFYDTILAHIKRTKRTTYVENLLKTLPLVTVAHFPDRISGVASLDVQGYPLPGLVSGYTHSEYFPDISIRNAVYHSSKPVFHAFKSELFDSQRFDRPFCFTARSRSVGHIADRRGDTHHTFPQISDFKTLFLNIPFKPFAVKIVQPCVYLLF